MTAIIDDFQLRAGNAICYLAGKFWWRQGAAYSQRGTRFL